MTVGDELKEIKSRFRWGEEHLPSPLDNMDEGDVSWLIEQLEQVQQENKKVVEQNKMMLSAFKDIQHESNDEESVHIASRVIETYQVLGEGGHKDA